MARPTHALFIVPVLLLGGSVSLRGQTGLEFGGVPAINFDADEGFGYEAVLRRG